MTPFGKCCGCCQFLLFVVVPRWLLKNDSRVSCLVFHWKITFLAKHDNLSRTQLVSAGRLVGREASTSRQLSVCGAGKWDASRCFNVLWSTFPPLAQSLFLCLWCTQQDHRLCLHFWRLVTQAICGTPTLPLQAAFPSGAG